MSTKIMTEREAIALMHLCHKLEAFAARIRKGFYDFREMVDEIETLYCSLSDAIDGDEGLDDAIARYVNGSIGVSAVEIDALIREVTK